MFYILRYDYPLGGGPILYASSASLTNIELISASEYTATVLMPICLQVLITLRVISPLLAINILSKVLG